LLFELKNSEEDIYCLEKKFNLLEKVIQEEKDGEHGWWEIRVDLEKILKRAENNPDILVSAAHLE